MQLAHLVFAAVLAWSSPVFAGITIHFSGSVPDDTSVEKIADVACAEAQKNAWRCLPVVGDEIVRLDGITAKETLIYSYPRFPAERI